MHDSVKNCIANGDIEGLKYIFKDALDVDPTFAKYRDDYNQVAKAELFQSHQELSSFNGNSSQWDMTYWKTLKKDLLKNFSRERVDHMQKVAQVIYADKISRKSEISESAEDKQQVLAKTEPQPKPAEIASTVPKTGKPKESKEEYQRRINKELAEDTKKYAPVNLPTRIEGAEPKKKRLRPIRQMPSGENQAESREIMAKIALAIFVVVIILLIMLR